MSARAPATVGWVGLGRMGTAMAKRMVEGGRALRVYNRTASAASALSERGAAVASCPADATEPGGIVCSMLADEAAVLAVCDGPQGLLARLRGGIHLSMSTLSPDAAERLARMHHDAGVDYVSAPVQGRPAMAEAGQLVAWVSGPVDERVESVLQPLCRQVIRLGPDVRLAAASKLALNFLMNANIAVFAEAFAYARTQGVDTRLLGNALTETAFAAPLFKAITAGLLAPGDTAQGSDVALSRKDLALLVDGAATGLELTLAPCLAELFARADEAGWGSLDPVSVRRFYANCRDTVQSPPSA